MRDLAYSQVGKTRALLKELLQGIENNDLVHDDRCRSGPGGRASGDFRSTIMVGEEKVVLNHSLVMLATGVEEVQPGEYLLGEHPGVITQMELSQRLAEGDKWVKEHQSVAMMLCAGSLEPGRNYCSRICCNQAVENALRLKQANPQSRVYVLHREMRTYGFFEQQYEAARRAGVIFLRYDVDRKPQIAPKGDSWK